MNIEGVQVLSKLPIFESPVYIPFAVVLFLIGALLSLYGIEKNWKTRWLLVYVGFMVIALGLGIAGTSGAFDKESGRYKYKCIVNEEASFTEIHDKYRLVDTDGDIWIFEDKE